MQARKAEIRQETKRREHDLLPVYEQISVHFADLHDTPVRMEAKGAIRGVVSWENARRFFYHRLCRRLAEERLVTACKAAAPTVTRADVFEHMATFVICVCVYVCVCVCVCPETRESDWCR